jgi:lysophospholipase L1-like esterase
MTSTLSVPLMNSLRAALVLLLFGISGPSLAQADQDGVTALKARIEKLEAENAAIKEELADLKQGLAALGKGGPARRQAEKATGPTPYPNDPQGWPGKGVIRVFDWMSQNRAYFWKFRDKKQGAVVFAGDSLTGNWGGLEKAFPKLNVANRGIGGDVSRGLLFRFQEDVLDLHPKAVVILIGSNDLSAKQDTTDTISNIAAILEMAERQDAALPIILCQIPPRASPEAPVDLSEVQGLNARIARLAEGRKQVTVLDLFGRFAKPDGSPDPQYFKPDELHLADPGYNKWRETLDPILSKLKQE